MIVLRPFLLLVALGTLSEASKKSSKPPLGSTVPKEEDIPQKNVVHGGTHSGVPQHPPRPPYPPHASPGAPPAQMQGAGPAINIASPITMPLVTTSPGGGGGGSPPLHVAPVYHAPVYYPPAPVPASPAPVYNPQQPSPQPAAGAARSQPAALHVALTQPAMTDLDGLIASDAEEPVASSPPGRHRRRQIVEAECLASEA
ncbi:predicted protein [Verticillium alfalfae VaMs.102]|uniref:Predicted protein n=1 Tax=Verticillium alfalfae (strain VaMs.102 / ATCC MYA-4576 / FGSC 10136) TaxID=526221 RepID=C9SR16_VERA1|nr:predicted protein [Verticillium alfalfae VaMs.102]EEY21291.1 predicted protein [Verticillium alfalfae VaMs.102]